MVKNDVFARERFVGRTFVDGKMFEQKEPARRPAAGPGQGASVTSSPAVMTVAGNFNVTIDVPGQALTGTLALIQQGPILTGTLTTQLGVVQIRDGKVTVDGFTFSGSVDFGGSQIEITVKGVVTGNQISGTIDSPQGAVPFSGTRNP